MKKGKLNFTIGLLSVALIFGCTKDPLNRSNLAESSSGQSNNISSDEFLELSQESYDMLKSNLTADFAGQQNSQQQNAIDVTNFTPNSSAIIPENLDNMFSNKGVDEVIRMNEAVIAKYPELIGHRSMFTVYNEALRIEDKTELRNYTERYNYFLTYIEEFNSVILSVPKYKAALLSPDGIIKIEKNIIQYTDENIKIIKDGDTDLINSLSKINKSTDKIEVLALETAANKSSTRVRNLSYVKYLGPNYPHNLFAVSVVKFVDSELYIHIMESEDFNPQTGQYETLYTYTYSTRYNVGSEIRSYFNGTLNPASIGVASVSNYQGQSSFTEYGWASNVLASTYHVYNYAPNNPLPPLSLDINKFSVVSFWRVVYANGVVFESRI